MLPDDFFTHIENQFNNSLPFVAYRKPNDSVAKALLQNTDNLYTTQDFKESGFVFAPFNTSEKTIFFPLDESDFIEDSFSKQQLHFKEKSFYNDASKACLLYTSPSPRDS